MSVTEVPAPKGDEQSSPQLIPPGVDATLPAPVPALVTESVYRTGGAPMAVPWKASTIAKRAMAPTEALIAPRNVLLSFMDSPSGGNARVVSS